MRNCTTCSEPISVGRLEVLPDATTCTKCSKTKKVLGFTISNYSKGTASELCFVQPDNSEAMRLAIRANRRAR